MLMLFATVLIDLIGFGIVIPILPYLAPTLGASNFDIALIIAVYSIFGGLCGPFWGKLSDRIGRKPVLLICLAGGALSYVMLAYSTTLLMLYLSRMLAGAMSGNFGVASAMVADISPPETRARSMGLIGSAFGLGMVVGPFLGGILAGDEGNFARAALCAAAISGTALVAGALLLRESLTPALRLEHAQHHAQHGNGGSVWQMLRAHHNTLLAAQYFLTNSCHTIVSYLFPLYVAVRLDWGARDVGMIFGIQGIAMAVLQAGLIGRLVRGMGELRLLVVGTLLMSGGFLVSALAEERVGILVGFFCAITGGTVCTPVLNTLVANRTPPHLRGRMLGTTAASAAFGRVFGPLLGGVMLSAFGYPAAWVCGTVIALMITAWAAAQLRRARAAQTLATPPLQEHPYGR